MDWFALFLIQRIYQSPLLLSIYKAYKYIIHWSTNSSEIYRICHATAKQLLPPVPPNVQDDDAIPLLDRSVSALEQLDERLPPEVVLRIDRSIHHSTKLQAERDQMQSSDVSINALTHAIFTKKHFPGSMSSPEGQVLYVCLARIVDTWRLTREVNDQAGTKYDSTNDHHEEKLLQLWQHLMPATKLEHRLTKQWTDIGFQGQDPATDFRGMGIQGLDDMLYYCKTYPDSAQRTFLTSQHPVSWYPFAIVGINISHFTLQILRNRQIQYYLFKFGIEHDAYQDLYCFLFHRFNDYWTSFDNPRVTVMDFERVFGQFKQVIQLQLFQLVPLYFVLRDNSKEWLDQEDQTTSTLRSR
ncbi:hypothetical protein DM01DRAFT_1383976 [Hesseltinella vesiculosa]|uniref:ELMO domain-containing protein n=1 Tax=Hesseltinella vesiculosa TaxID=101127 RepID=A0A1X2GFU7_9FUNG|nr:hypothetical protein DM01DRAFT_1383976 [Hesseltinella vesiculosa]